MRTFHINDFCGTELPLTVWLETPWRTEDSHRHDCYEMVFMNEGSGVCILNGQRMPMMRGDMFLCTPTDTHGFTYSKKITFYNIMFSISLFNRSERAVFQPLLSHAGKYSFSPSDTRRLLDMLHVIAMELTSGTADSVIYARAKFVAFLVEIFRHSAYEAPKAGDNLKSALEIRLLDCISTSFRSHLTLTMLAKEIGMSTEYTRRLIKRMTGGTLTSCVRTYRMEEARLQLENSDLTIAEIAELLGYYDISHFSKQFQQVYHSSPKRYRANYRAGGKRPKLIQLAVQRGEPPSEYVTGKRPSLDELAERRRLLPGLLDEGEKDDGTNASSD